MTTSLKEYFTERVVHWMSTSLKEYFTDRVLPWLSTSLDEYFNGWVLYWMSTPLNENFTEWVLAKPHAVPSEKHHSISSVARILWSFVYNYFTLFLVLILGTQSIEEKIVFMYTTSFCDEPARPGPARYDPTMTLFDAFFLKGFERSELETFT